MKNKLALWMLSVILLIIFLAACDSEAPDKSGVESSDDISSSSQESESEKIVGTTTLATTKEIYNSSFFDYILSQFEMETQCAVNIIAVEKDELLQKSIDGSANLFLIQDEEYAQMGFEGTAEKFDIMYGDLIIVGPEGGEIAYNNDEARTFREIAEKNLVFVGRDEDCLVRQKEQAIWNGLEGINVGDMQGYVGATGVYEAFDTAKELTGYTLVDRMSWLALTDKTGLGIICENSETLRDYYMLVIMNDADNDASSVAVSQKFVVWITGASGQERIANFGYDEFDGETVFTPNALIVQ